MARSNRHHRFTVYDLMEAKGIFEANPANADSPKYTENGGPVPYPKMFYHPKGETRVTTPADILQTPFGPKMTAEFREIITRLANNYEEEEELRKGGWHDHPAKAMRAGGADVVPPITHENRVADLEQQIIRLQKERDEARAARLPGKGAA